MDCQCCNKKPARIRICDVEENVISEQMNICPDCFALIKRYMFDMTKPLMDTTDVIAEVQTLLNAGETALAKLPESGGITTVESKSVPRCPECGMTLSEFRARGRFGCPRDYEVFAEHLDPLFERIHDVQPARHEGRLPVQPDDADETASRPTQLIALKRRLDAAVKEEDFELAAKLRDEIQSLEAEPAEETS